VKALISLILLFSLQALAEHQVALLGLTVHALGAEGMDPKIMKNKIDSNGITALNPQLNYAYINSNDQIYQAALIQDCYKHAAILLAYGKRYEVETDFYLGWELGIYGRQVPKDTKANDMRMMRQGIYQIFPTPGFIAQYNLTENLVIRVQSNLVINFFDIAFKF
jgi:hypothetical protein